MQHRLIVPLAILALVSGCANPVTDHVESVRCQELGAALGPTPSSVSWSPRFVTPYGAEGVAVEVCKNDACQRVTLSVRTELEAGYTIADPQGLTAPGVHALVGGALGAPTNEAGALVRWNGDASDFAEGDRFTAVILGKNGERLAETRDRPTFTTANASCLVIKEGHLCESPEDCRD